MKHWLCILALAVTLPAVAAPDTAVEDDLARLIADKALLSKLGEVGHSVKARAAELVVTAMGFLGVPYRRGGESASGFDCSGFVRAMYEQTVGLVLPRR